MFIVIIFVFFKNQINSSKYFTATTSFKGVDIVEEYKYYHLNQEKFFPISKEKFLNLFTEILNEKKLFEEAIIKFNLLDSSQYSNEQDYSEAVSKFASMIKITSHDKTSTSGDTQDSYSAIRIKYDDYKKWKRALIYIDKEANKIETKL